MDNSNLHCNIKVGLVQINNSFSNQNYLPYSIGLLQVYAQKYVSSVKEFEFLLPIYKRVPVEEAVNDLLTADLVFFSTYVWNTIISLEIARRIKSERPESLMVFGGPNVPDRKASEFLHQNWFVDIVCHGEGERTFASVLENYHARDWKKVPSISYINSENDFIRNPAYERISNLNEIPSPYLEGIFDPLMRANTQEEWITLLETNRGCPFSCTYCDWGSATKNKVYSYDVDKIFEEIEWFSRHKIEFLFCCDANFGMLVRDVEIVRYIAENKKKHGYPKAFSVQNTKNSTKRIYDIYKIMADAGLNKGVSLSLQSLNTSTLKDIKRENISINAFEELQSKFTNDNIETFTDLILGLPGETYNSFADGTSSAIEKGQHNRIQFNNLSILPNAEMGNEEYQEKYGFNIVETKIINIHGSLSNSNEIHEKQRLVVETSTMPKADWVRVRVFAWMASLLYFNKLLQIPLAVLFGTCSVRPRELIELFVTSDHTSPILSEIHSFFVDKAVDIQSGGAEYCESKKWLNIWWPADELILIKLCTENKLSSFYVETEKAINRLMKQKELLEYFPVIHESIYLNHNIIKLPFQDKDLDVHLSYNVWDAYQAAIRGKDFLVEKGRFDYQIDRTSDKWVSWEDWCKRVIWYGNKKGAYIYNCRTSGSKVCSS